MNTVNLKCSDDWTFGDHFQVQLSFPGGTRRQEKGLAYQVSSGWAGQCLFYLFLSSMRPFQNVVSKVVFAIDVAIVRDTGRPLSKVLPCPNKGSR